MRLGRELIQRGERCTLPGGSLEADSTMAYLVDPQQLDLELYLDRLARRAVNVCFDRPLLLEAGAGTGKTTVLVSRIVAWSIGPGWQKALSEQGRSGGGAVDVHRTAELVCRGIAAITFTERAAQDIAEKLGEALAAVASGRSQIEGCAEADHQRSRAEAIGSAVELAFIGTIHAFCRQIINWNPTAAGGLWGCCGRCRRE